jgi:hypothetical protein
MPLSFALVLPAILQHIKHVSLRFDMREASEIQLYKLPFLLFQTLSATYHSKRWGRRGRLPGDFLLLGLIQNRLRKERPPTPPALTNMSARLAITRVLPLLPVTCHLSSSTPSSSLSTPLRFASRSNHSINTSSAGLTARPCRSSPDSESSAGFSTRLTRSAPSSLVSIHSYV